MRESVIYQDILQEGRKEGMEAGRQEGETTLILRQLARRMGALAPELEGRIRGLSIVQLEDLAEALLYFSKPADLVTWLEGQAG